MGCTSSAPNMADNPQTDATENPTNFKKEADEVINKQDEDNINVKTQNSNEALPSCDNFSNNKQIDNTNKYSSNINNDEDLNAKENTETSESKNEVPTIEIDEKITSLKEIADKMIVNKILEDLHVEEVTESPPIEESKGEKVNDEIEIIIGTEQTNPEIATEDLENVEEEININEHESPTQSDCSRSTRWEALADIAAELPPSLAVDPVTGHIYTLTK